MSTWTNANDTPRFHQCEFAHVCGSCGACPLYTICDGMRDTEPPTGYANSWGSILNEPTENRIYAVMAARRAGLNFTLSRRLPQSEIIREGFKRGLLPLPITVEGWMNSYGRLPLSQYSGYRQWLKQVRGE